jgi:tungstate transport system ATP-binding protein
MASPAPRDVLPLEARALTVRLGAREVLSHVSFRLEPGLRTVVLGPNGAGKTSLLRALHGLVPAAAGTITWGGAPRPRGAEAMVFQRPVMLRRGALANVEYALAVNGVGGSERRRRAREALERAGLASLAQRPARVLSGGEQQRLALARAWALRPRILYLDEPTASLDPTAAAEIEREIGAIHAAGTRIVMTTHHLGLARRIADEILFLHDGRLVEQTPAERFFDAPRSEEARQFLEGELPWSTA